MRRWRGCAPRPAITVIGARAQDLHDLATRPRGVRTRCETTLEKHPIPKARVFEDHTTDAGTARSFDSERGRFDPPHHVPLRNLESNPRGIRRIDETAQDHVAVADRPRYKAAQGCRSRMVISAMRRLRNATGERKAPSRSAPG